MSDWERGDYWEGVDHTPPRASVTPLNYWEGVATRVHRPVLIVNARDLSFEEVALPPDITSLKAIAAKYTSPTGRLTSKNPVIQGLQNATVTFNYSAGDIDMASFIIGNSNPSNREAFEQMLITAARELAKYEKYPKQDPCVDGDVIKFIKVFPGSDKEWLFAAVRADGRYYVTGAKSNPQGYTWSGLVDLMSDQVQEVFVVTEHGWAQIVPALPPEIEAKVEQAIKDHEDGKSVPAERDR